MLLSYDTETTGIPEFKKPSEDPCQPHIVQLAAILRSGIDKAEQPFAVMNRIIKPDGWTIDEAGDAFKAHGITNERANDEGVPITEALDEFLALVNQAHDTTGFNLQFDRRLLRIQEKRRHGGGDDIILPIGEALETRNEIELSHRMTKHCNLPPTDKMMAAGRKTAKTPKLEEAFRHCYGPDADIGRQHDALTDVKQSLAIFWWLRDRGEV